MSAPKNNINTYYSQCWYSLSANRLVVTLGTLKDEINCDVCVVGGGFTGISTALELSEKGLSVVLLETTEITGGLLGRNSGIMYRGFDKSPATLSACYGHDNAKMLSDMTMEGLELILSRISKHSINCDLKLGHLTAALNDTHMDHLKYIRDAWAKIGHHDLEIVNKARVQEMVSTKKYTGGLFDAKAAHFHPLNYALGILQAAQRLGCKVHDQTRAIEIVHGKKPSVITDQGRVNAKFVVLAGTINIKGAESLKRKIIHAAGHIIATEPLPEERARKLIPADISVTDARFVMDYFSLSGDNRLLFGGNCNYSGRNVGDEDMKLRKRMLALFPSLHASRIAHCWHGIMDLTLNRMPHVGRLSDNVFYAHGFGGHGVIATNIVGKVMAEAISGTAERFDVFTKINHLTIPGGNIVKRPVFMVGVLWYKLRDLL